MKTAKELKKGCGENYVESKFKEGKQINLRCGDEWEGKRYYCYDCIYYARGRLEALEWIKDKSGLVSGKGFDIEEEIFELKELLGEKE